MRFLNTSTTHRQALIGAIAAFSGFLVLLGWALSAPVGSSPDDHRHLSSIWCAQGDTPGICQRETPDLALVSRGLTGSHWCYATFRDVSADCQPDRDVPLSQQPLEAGDISFLNQTPALFYWAMSTVVTTDLERSVLLIRLINALLAVALVTAAAILLASWARAGLILAWIVTPIPLGLSLIPSTNPSSWAIIGVGTYWAFLLALWTVSTTRRRIAAGALASLAAILAIGSRTDSAAFIVLVTLAMAVIIWLPRRADIAHNLHLLAVPIIASVVGFVVFITRPQSAVATDGLGAEQEPAGEGLSLLFQNSHALPGFWLGSFGGVPLGWFDTVMPTLVVFVAGTSFFALALLGMRTMGLPKALGLLIVFAGFSALPLWVFQVGGRAVGEEIQPRYFLPLLFAFLGIAVIDFVGRSDFRMAPAQAIILGTAWILAATLALTFQIRRYSVGSGSVFDAMLEPRWWSQSIASPPIVVAISGVAFAALVGCSLLLIHLPAVHRDELTRESPKSA